MSRRIILSAVIAVAVIAIAAAMASGGGPAATYRARVQNTAVINPADLAITVRVTDTGHAAGTPQCTVQASDPSAAYTGTDVATLSGTLKPGRFAVYVDNVTITGQGARYVTAVKVSCQ